MKPIDIVLLLLVALLIFGAVMLARSGRKKGGCCQCGSGECTCCSKQKCGKIRNP